MAAAQEEDFVDYEEEEEQVAVQTGKDTKKYETLSSFQIASFISVGSCNNSRKMKTISSWL